MSQTYQDVQKLRAKFPRILTPEQQEEFLNLLDSNDRDRNLCLGFIIDCDCPESERDLHWRYEARMAAFDAEKNQKRYENASSESLAELQGHLLACFLGRPFECKDKRKAEARATAIFNAWKSKTSPELFLLQIKGIEKSLDIHLSVYKRKDKFYKCIKQLCEEYINGSR